MDANLFKTCNNDISALCPIMILFVSHYNVSMQILTCNNNISALMYWCTYLHSFISILLMMLIVLNHNTIQEIQFVLTTLYFTSCILFNILATNIWGNWYVVLKIKILCYQVDVDFSTNKRTCDACGMIKFY